MKIDLHIHTKASKDSNIDPEDLLRRAKKVGLDGIAVTDHDTVEMVEEVKSYSDGIKVIPGIEVSTERGEILGLFVEENIESETAEEAIEEIKSKGGIAVLPHPFSPIRGFDTPENLKGIDGLEVLNSRSLSTRINERARVYAENEGLIKTAGSDAHTLREVGGSYVEAEAENLKEFRKELIEGNVTIGGYLNTPLYHIISTFNKLRSFLTRKNEDKK